MDAFLDRWAPRVLRIVGRLLMVLGAIGAGAGLRLAVLDFTWTALAVAWLNAGIVAIGWLLAETDTRSDPTPSGSNQRRRVTTQQQGEYR